MGILFLFFRKQEMPSGKGFVNILYRCRFVQLHLQMKIRCRLTALELLDYLEGMCVSQALCASYLRRSEGFAIVRVQCSYRQPQPCSAPRLTSFGDLFTNGKLEESEFYSQR